MSSLDLNPDPHFESELARRRALYCLHDAGRILSDATSFFSSLDERKAITQIVGEIQTIERKLDGALLSTEDQQPSQIPSSTAFAEKDGQQKEDEDAMHLRPRIYPIAVSKTSRTRSRG
jgi:hypothetical protein